MDSRLKFYEEKKLGCQWHVLPFVERMAAVATCISGRLGFSPLLPQGGFPLFHGRMNRLIGIVLF